MPGLRAGTQLRTNKSPASSHPGRIQPALQLVAPPSSTAAAHNATATAHSPQHRQQASASRTAAKIVTASPASYRRQYSSTMRLSPQPVGGTACPAPWDHVVPSPSLPDSAQYAHQNCPATAHSSRSSSSSSSSSRKLHEPRRQQAAVQQLQVLPQQQLAYWSSSSWHSFQQPVVAAAVAAAADDPSGGQFHQQQQQQQLVLDADTNHMLSSSMHSSGSSSSSSSDGRDRPTATSKSASPHAAAAAANTSSAVAAWESKTRALRLQPVRLPSRRRSSSSFLVAQQQQQQQQQQLTKLKQLVEHPQQWMQLHQQPWQHSPRLSQHMQMHTHPAHHQQQQDQQQQQQHLPPELEQQPARDQPVWLEISALWQRCVSDVQQLERLNFQSRRQPRRQRQKSEVLDHQQQQQQRAMAAEEPQQLLWVTIHQPGGPGTAAAVWVGKAWLNLGSQQLHLLGEGKEQQAYVQLQRPDLGLAPAAVEYGHTFQHCWWAQRGNGHGSYGSSSSSSGSGGFQRHIQECTPAQAADVSAAAAAADDLSDTASDTAAVALESSADAAGDLQNNGDSSSSSSSHNNGWYDYLLLVEGDFSVREHENMFPNALSHCGDGRIMYQARHAHDVAAFVAEAQEAAMQEHMKNLIRLAWDKREPDGDRKPLDPAWVLRRLRQRWGLPAMVQFGVDMTYFSKIFHKCGVVELPEHAATAAGSK